MKRKILKILSAVLALSMLVSFAVACGDDVAECESLSSESVSENASASGSENIEDNGISIFTDGKYQCEFIQPANPTQDEKTVISVLKSSLQKQLKRQVVVRNDDYAVEDGKLLVLIGNTKYEESKNAQQALGERQCSVKFDNNKLVIAFNSVGAGKAAVNSLVEKLAECDIKEVKLMPEYSFKYSAKGDSSLLPEYPADNIKECFVDDNTLMKYIVGENQSVFDDYCNQIKATGFELVESKTIANGNYTNSYQTFVGEDEYVYAYYTGIKYEARIITGPLESLGGLKEAAVLEEKYEPSVSMIGQIANTNCGQGYIFLLPDGRLLVQDGGDRYSGKPDFIYEAMKQIAPDPNNIVIAAWFVSHPHDDHQYAFEEFIEKHANDKTVKIEQLVYCYGVADDYDFTRGDGVTESGSRMVNSMLSISSKLTDTEIIRPHTGQVLSYGSVDVEILFTVEDLYPATFGYINTTSMVIRVNIGGQSIMLLADTTHASGDILTNTFGSYLESDMVQLAHHGMYSVNPTVYNCIKAPVVLWPNNVGPAMEKINDSEIKAALTHATDVYIAGSTVTTLKLPYTCINNKADVVG